MFLPGESHGQRRQVLCSPWGRRAGHNWEIKHSTDLSCRVPVIKFYCSNGWRLRNSHEDPTGQVNLAINAVTSMTILPVSSSSYYLLYTKSPLFIQLPASYPFRQPVRCKSSVTSRKIFNIKKSQTSTLTHIQFINYK